MRVNKEFTEWRRGVSPICFILLWKLKLNWSRNLVKDHMAFFKVKNLSQEANQLCVCLPVSGRRCDGDTYRLCRNI